MNEEQELWKGSPSQWSNFLTYLICLMFSWLIFPIFIAAWKYLIVSSWKIEITNQRVIEEKGVLSKTTDELELYRVKDIRLNQPFWLRLVGLSTIVLITSDKSNPTLKIPAIKNGSALRENLRSAIEIRRDRKNVREVDFQ